MYRNNLSSIKAVNSWLQVYHVALDLFEKKGFHQTTMRMIASAADCSLGSIYRYFGSKEEIILALYERLSDDLEDTLKDLPKGNISRRFTYIMEAKFQLIKPYEKMLGSLIGNILDPNQSIGATGKQTEIIRLKNMAIFNALVLGASDAPKSTEKCYQISRTLYSMHFVILFLWFFDKGSEKDKIKETLRLVEKLLKTNQSLLNPFTGYVYNILDNLFNQFFHLTTLENDTKLSKKIVELVFEHRKLNNPGDKCYSNPCNECYAIHLARVQYFIQQNQPIHFLLPAFPAKSPNIKKVLGKLPDLGEEIALNTLQGICNKIKDIYKPGAYITICADGRVFSDLVKVTDEDVTAYTDHIKQMVAEQECDSLKLMNLENFIVEKDFQSARNTLIEKYAKSLEYHDDRRKNQEDYQHFFNGIHKFITEDQEDLFPEISKTQFKIYSKEIARQLIQRSDAWGSLLQDIFPYSIRLSIHPQHPHSTKIGINITKATDNWITPWHGVILAKDNNYVLVKKKEAEELGAELICKNNKPYYFALNE